MGRLKDQLGKKSSARRLVKEAEGFGKVLFVEPVLSDIEAAQKAHLHYDVVAGKDGESTIKIDTEKSDMAAYTRALVALTVRDVETGALEFENAEDVRATFAQKDENGAPRHGSGLYNELAKHAQEVCGVDLSEKEKKAAAVKK